MAKFAASVAWRALSYLSDELGANDMSPNLTQDVQRALASWKAFCLGDVAGVGANELHLIPLGAIAETTVADLPRKINRYLLCVTELDFLRSDTTTIVMVKMLRLLMIGFVRETEPHLWQGTRINLSGGELAPSRLSAPDWLLSYLRGRAERLAELEDSISAKQKRNSRDDQANNRDRVLESETMQALIADRLLQHRPDE